MKRKLDGSAPTAYEASSAILLAVNAFDENKKKRSAEIKISASVLREISCHKLTFNFLWNLRSSLKELGWFLFKIAKEEYVLISVQEYDSWNDLDLESYKKKYGTLFGKEIVEIFPSIASNQNVSNNRFLFKYNLLHEGKFFYRWKDNLDNYFKMTFRLTENGQDAYKTQEDLLKDFQGEQGSISRKYFNFSTLSQYLIPKGRNINFRNAIESRFGFWVPKIIYDRLFPEKEKFEQFKEKLFQILDAQMETATASFNQDYSKLYKEGFIEAPDERYYTSIENKVQRIKEYSSLNTLERIYYRAVSHDMPYAIEEQIKIEELFDEMIERCKSQLRRNPVQQAFLSAVWYRDLSIINNEESYPQIFNIDDEG